MSGCEDGIPWRGLVAAALRMGLTPEAFWRTSLAEWRLLIAGAHGGEALGRAEFDALLRACGELEVKDAKR